MATILAYTSPALGHMLPMSALLCELQRRGHDIRIHTLSATLDTARGFGFRAEPIDSRIEAIAIDDWRSSNRLGALKRGVAAFAGRAGYEVGDLRAAIEASDPDFLLVDVNCWGALSVAETAAIPWACFAPDVPPLRATGLPPFGPGLPPLPGLAGRLRDAALNATVTRSVEKVLMPALNSVREELGLPTLNAVDTFLRRAPMMLLASGTPFQYPQIEWGDAVHMIGPCEVDPVPNSPTDWLDRVDRPVVLVTTSSEQQADSGLVLTAITALAGSDVHVVATMPAGSSDAVADTADATVRSFVPHGVVLRRAVCAITHGGMGATQKALAHGVPVCVVPYGRDQFEVARRVEVARCGTRLPAGRLSPSRLRAKVHEAMGMAAGARRVAAGFEATGGVGHGADLIEAALA